MSTLSQCKGCFLVKPSSQQTAINCVIASLGVSPFFFQYAKNGNNLLKNEVQVAVLEDKPPAGAQRCVDIPMAAPSPLLSLLFPSLFVTCMISCEEHQ